MDYFIILLTTASGLYFHWWLYVRIKFWMDRDLALSLANSDPDKKAYMLEQLTQLYANKVPRKLIPDRLARAAAKWTKAPSAQIATDRSANGS